MVDFKSYWDRFFISNNQGKGHYDGIAFEELVEELLAIMYEKRWINTPKTHDGNKDFFLFTETERLWAECKNYKEPIAMKVLAPTLVMAQVCDASAILFFSRSYINKSAKEKISSYGSKTNKKIIFYDANLLEQLIVMHNDKLSSRFQLSSESLEVDIPNKTVEISEFFFPSIFSSMVTTEDNYKNYTYAKILHYNEPFSLLLTLNNNSLQSNKVEISFASDDNNRFFYEYLNKDISVNEKIIAKKVLQAGESIAFLINLRVSIFQASLSLPQFEVYFTDSNGKISKWKSQNVRRHIVGGTNGMLFSVLLPPRPRSLVGDRRLWVGQPHAVVALFER